MTKAQDQRLQSMKEQAYNKDRDHDKSNLMDLMKECHNELTSGEIVSLKNIESNEKFSSGPIHLVTDETVIKEWEDRMEKAATTASSLEAEQDNGNINRTQSMATLNESFPHGTDSGSGPRVNTLESGEDNMKLMELMEHCTKLSELNPNLTSLYQMANLDFYDKHNMVAYLQKSEGSEGFHQIIDFLTTSYISTLENGDMEITATIDGKVNVVFKASIKRHLKLEDFDGISTLPTSKIFEQLALMSSKKTDWEQFSSNIATAIICLATNRNFNISKLIFDAMGEGSTILVESHHTPISAPSTSQPPTLPPSIQTTHVAEEAATMPHDSPLLRVYSLGSDEGSMTLNELMVLCTTLSKKMETLESNLKQTKLTYGAAYTKRIMKVKKLEHKVKSSKARRRVRLVVSEDEDELEDPSKLGRKIAQIDEDEGITLVQMSAQTQGRHEHDFEFIAPEEDYTGEPDISTADVPVSTAGAEVSTANPKVKTATESLVYIRRSAAKRKDKGKAIMKEAEPVQKKTKLQLEKERLGLEEALRLQEQLDEEERQRIARVHEEASTFNAEEWDNIHAQIEADEELAHRLQAQERERYSEADKARLLVELINERKRKFAQQRAEQRRNKPMTQAQQRTYMCNYIKNMGSHTLQQLKKLSFDEVKELFETTMKRVNTFTPMESDDTVPKVVAGSSKIDAEQELNQESSKRQKIGEGSEPAEESKDELSQEQLQQLMIIVPEEGMNVEALQTKYPIID
ncbi:hypothetical protein Tco_0511641 [Tanacetum coccineum]